MEGVIVTIIICATTIVLALIIKSILLKLSVKDSQKGNTEVKNDYESRTKRFQKRCDLIDQLLALESEAAKKESRYKDDVQKYRSTLETYIKEFTDSDSNREAVKVNKTNDK